MGIGIFCLSTSHSQQQTEQVMKREREQERGREGVTYISMYMYRVVTAVHRRCNYYVGSIVMSVF